MVKTNDIVLTKGGRVAVVERMAWMPYRGTGRWVAGVRMAEDGHSLAIVASSLRLHPWRKKLND